MHLDATMSPEDLREKKLSESLERALNSRDKQKFEKIY